MLIGAERVRTDKHAGEPLRLGITLAGLIPGGNGKAPGLTRSYERMRNTEDMFYVDSKSQPMSVTREKDVLMARATIGVASQGNRGFKNLFR